VRYDGSAAKEYAGQIDVDDLTPRVRRIVPALVFGPVIPALATRMSMPPNSLAVSARLANALSVGYVNNQPVN